MRTTRFNGVELPVRELLLRIGGHELTIALVQNVSKLKATEFSIGIPRTEPNIEISITSSSGPEAGEKDIADMV